jgi:hypothetical protein
MRVLPCPEAIFNFPFEIEHFIPSSRGGVDEKEKRPASQASIT